MPGAFTLADINLEGATQLPTPDLVINFRSFALDAKSPFMSAVTICDTTLQEGQGMHGSFNRADTFNHMAAYGPDFKKRFDDKAPVGNTDVALTVAAILKLEIPHKGHLLGRVLKEALMDGPARSNGPRPRNHPHLPRTASRPLSFCKKPVTPVLRCRRFFWLDCWGGSGSTSESVGTSCGSRY